MVRCHPFPWLRNSMCGCEWTDLLTHPPAEGHVGGPGLGWCPWCSSNRTCACVSLIESFPWITTQKKWRDHTVVLFRFLRHLSCFPQWLPRFASPTVHEGFLYSASFSDTLCFFLVTAVGRCEVISLSYWFTFPHDWGHSTSFPGSVICASSLETNSVQDLCLFCFLCYFKLDFLNKWILRILYISGVLIPHGMYPLKILSPSLEVVFLLCDGFIQCGKTFSLWRNPVYFSFCCSWMRRFKKKSLSPAPTCLLPVFSSRILHFPVLRGSL